MVASMFMKCDALVCAVYTDGVRTASRRHILEANLRTRRVSASNRLQQRRQHRSPSASEASALRSDNVTSQRLTLAVQTRSTEYTRPPSLPPLTSRALKSS